MLPLQTNKTTADRYLIQKRLQYEEGQSFP